MPHASQVGIYDVASPGERRVGALFNFADAGPTAKRSESHRASIAIRHAAVALGAVALFAGCGSSEPADAEVRAALDRGIAQIRETRDPKQLQARLLRTVKRLRAARAETGAGRRARRLALAGFARTLRGIESKRAFYENDSGNVAAATRDAMSERRSFTHGAELLRAAGRALGVKVGTLAGY